LEFLGCVAVAGLGFPMLLGGEAPPQIAVLTVDGSSRTSLGFAGIRIRDHEVHTEKLPYLICTSTPKLFNGGETVETVDSGFVTA
jgi:hypothetical protein